jgi:transposase
MQSQNALFAGSDEGSNNWAVIATLIENCKLSGNDPNAWLSATLSSLANGHPANRVGELMPWADVG